MLIIVMGLVTMTGKKFEGTIVDESDMADDKLFAKLKVMEKQAIQMAHPEKRITTDDVEAIRIKSEEKAISNFMQVSPRALKIEAPCNHNELIRIEGGFFQCKQCRMMMEVPFIIQYRNDYLIALMEKVKKAMEVVE